jgi:tRNA pseudouridine38-40 synthase
MRRIRIVVAYDGTEFHGWQKQPGLATIQGELERILSEIDGAPVHVHGSGRTDAGVHALAQVAAFDLNNPIPVYNLRKAINRLLPRDIRVLSVDEAALDFHPRYHASAKVYEYRIWRGEICPPFEHRYWYHFPYPLDIARMQSVARLFCGEHDFSAFAAADERDSEDRSMVRSIYSSEMELADDRLCYRVRGSGFLKHMVRHIVGFLIEAGKGNAGEDHLRSLLENPGPRKSGPAAPARGLFLIRVEYDAAR